MVGNLRPQKNHELALRALADLRRHVPAAWLVLAGDGERRERLEAMARDLGVGDRARFLGARLDVPELFGTFDIYCLPSHFEGMPLSILEAMAARKPVVGTRVPGIDDLIEDEVTGLLTPANDAKALSQALLRVHADRGLGQRLVDAGWRHVDRHGRFETMVQQYADLYEALAKSSDGGGQMTAVEGKA
jgi:glycosyltransferase involved in cell wall biosynthesis